jgi:lincosamide nucleotidyltransferase B/F
MCADEGRIRAALTYGSVPQGRDDDHSDAEFWIFVDDPEFDTEAWIREVAPTTFIVLNEYDAVVAVFPGLLRGEFHVRPGDAVHEVARWPARGADVGRMVLVDRTGELTTILTAMPRDVPVPTGEDAREMASGRFADAWLLGWHVLARGEIERAYDAMSQVRRHLLWMARLRRGAVQRWLTPSRLAERDLPAADLEALAAVSARLDPGELRSAFEAAWELGRRWWTELVAVPPADLFAEIDAVVRQPPNP